MAIRRGNLREIVAELKSEIVANDPIRQRILKYKKADESYDECLNRILDEWEKRKK